MQTPLTQTDKNGLTQLDRTIRTLEEERAKLLKRFTAMYSFASVLTVAGIVLAVVFNAFLPNGNVVLTAVAAGLLTLAAILALAAMGSQTKYILKNRPLSDWKEIRQGLRNAGFRYGNHRAFFGKYLVFREQKGNSVAIVDRKQPFSPFIAYDDAALTLSLDGKIAFVARLNQNNPEIRNFIVHPDYRYRKNKKPIYEKAALQIHNEANDCYRFGFDFGNNGRRQFLSLISYLC